MPSSLNRIGKISIGVDWLLVAFLLPVLAAGLVTMKSFTADTPYFSHQFLFIGISFIIFFVFSFIDFRFLRRTDVLVTIFLFFYSASDGNFICRAYLEWGKELVQLWRIFIPTIRHDEARFDFDFGQIFLTAPCGNPQYQTHFHISSVCYCSISTRFSTTRFW
jgi:hypothetical protein